MIPSCLPNQRHLGDLHTNKFGRQHKVRPWPSRTQLECADSEETLPRSSCLSDAGLISITAGSSAPADQHPLSQKTKGFSAISLSASDQTPQILHTKGLAECFLPSETLQVRFYSFAHLSTFLSLKLLQSSSLYSQHSIAFSSPVPQSLPQSFPKQHSQCHIFQVFYVVYLNFKL